MKRLTVWSVLFVAAMLSLSCQKKKISTSPPPGVVALEVKATILSNNSSVENDEEVKLEVVHTAGLAEKIIWYFDDGSGEIELQSDISPIFLIDSFSLANEGTYRVEVFQAGVVMATDTFQLTKADTTPAATPDPNAGGNSELSIDAQSVGFVKNVYRKGVDVFIKAHHDYNDFDSFKWLLDGVELVGETAAALTLSPSLVADSGEYELQIIKGGNTVDSATFPIEIVDPIASTFVNCAGDPDSCPSPILIPNDGSLNNCPAGQIATSCNGKREQGCLYDSAADGFRCTDEGDGNGCYLYCHDTVTSQLESALLNTGGFNDFFEAITFKESDGEKSCRPGFFPTGCSGYADQGCEATTLERFKCIDDGDGDDEGCQIFCWQAFEHSGRQAIVDIDEGDKATCADGYVPTGCSGDDEDYCKPLGGGEYRCVDHFWGKGCQLHCTKLD